LDDRLIGDIIEKEGIDFYRQDFNMGPEYHWLCNDAPDRQGITENKHVTGYYAYWDGLVARFPKLWLDSCASGGNRNDLETMRRRFRCCAVIMCMNRWASMVTRTVWRCGCPSMALGIPRLICICCAVCIVRDLPSARICEIKIWIMIYCERFSMSGRRSPLISTVISILDGIYPA